MDGPKVIDLCNVGPGEALKVNSPAFKNFPLFSKTVLVSTTWFTSLVVVKPTRESRCNLLKIQKGSHLGM